MPITAVGTASTAFTGGTTTTVTNNVPAGTQQDDYLLWTIATATSGVPTALTGWTLLLGAATTALTMTTWVRRVEASAEPASYTITVPSSRHSGVMRARRGVDLTTPIDVTSTTSTGTTADVAPAAISPITAGAWVDVAKSVLVATTVTSAPYTSTNLTLDANNVISASSAVETVLATGWAERAATGSFSPNLAQATAITQVRSHTIALRPAPGGVTPAAIPRNIRVVNPATVRSSTW